MAATALKQAHVIRFPKRKGGDGEEVTLADLDEAIGFVQREIWRSKIKMKVLARRAKVGEQTVSRLAYGETQKPHMLTVIAILTALGYEIIARR